MTRVVVVVERKRWPPWRGRDGFDRIVAALAERYRFMPDTHDRPGANFVDLPFSRRKNLDDARHEVAEALDGIDAQWRRHASIIGERTGRPPPQRAKR